jgi:hypothetical protein
VVVSDAERVQAGILAALRAEQKPLTLDELASVTGYDGLDLYMELNIMVRDGLIEATLVPRYPPRGRRLGRPSRKTAWKLWEPTPGEV